MTEHPGLDEATAQRAAVDELARLGQETRLDEDDDRFPSYRLLLFERDSLRKRLARTHETIERLTAELSALRAGRAAGADDESRHPRSEVCIHCATPARLASTDPVIDCLRQECPNVGSADSDCTTDVDED